MSNHDEPNYDELDAVLDIVEPLFHSLAGEHKLVGASVERWRWDEPVIVLTWTERNNIGKNVAFSIEGEAPPYELAIEVNAWFDNEEEKVRKWQHTHIATIRVAGIEETRAQASDLRELIGAGYNTVAGWETRDLRETYRFASQVADLAEAHSS